LQEQKKVTVVAEVDMDGAIHTKVVAVAVTEEVMVVVAAVVVTEEAEAMENLAMHTEVAKVAVVVVEPEVHHTKNVVVVRDTAAAVVTKPHEKEKHISFTKQRKVGGEL
jgi:hypothetical protein